MKSIKRRFTSIQKRQPYWSSFACFAVSVWGQELNRQTIHRWFYRLVDSEDYDRSDRKEIFYYLERLTNEKVSYMEWLLNTNLVIEESETKAAIKKHLERLSNVDNTLKTCRPQGGIQKGVIE